MSWVKLQQALGAQTQLAAVLFTLSWALVSSQTTMETTAAMTTEAPTTAPVTNEVPTTTPCPTLAPTPAPTPATCTLAGGLTVNNFGGCPTKGRSDNITELAEELEELTTKVAILQDRLDRLQPSPSCPKYPIPGPGDPDKGKSKCRRSDTVIRDCEDIFNRGNQSSGIYTIWPLNCSCPFQVLCEFDLNGRWTVIQVRSSGNVDFQRNWVEYKRGFGYFELDEGFWLGNEKIHKITSQHQYTLRVDIRDWDSAMRFAQYRYFQIGPESGNYKLGVKFYSGNAGDSLSNYHEGLEFSTFDHDNDHANQNCAYEHGGGWWYRDCDNANLNGQYRYSSKLLGNVDNGIEWDEWRKQYSFMGSKMRIKRTFPINLINQEELIPNY